MSIFASPWPWRAFRRCRPDSAGRDRQADDVEIPLEVSAGSDAVIEGIDEDYRSEPGHQAESTCKENDERALRRRFARRLDGGR